MRRYPTEPASIGERTGRAFDRGFDPIGTMRQAVAVLASGDRTPKLRELDVPALVIHGDADPLVDISGGGATAAAIPGAMLVVLKGMGTTFRSSSGRRSRTKSSRSGAANRGASAGSVAAVA